VRPRAWSAARWAATVVCWIGPGCGGGAGLYFCWLASLRCTVGEIVETQDVGDGQTSGTSMASSATSTVGMESLSHLILISANSHSTDIKALC
jgi:hypothetical protein